MPLYLYIIILSLLVPGSAGLVLYFWLQKRKIYSRFTRFSETLTEGVSGIDPAWRPAGKDKLTNGDMEDIRDFINSFSSEIKKSSRILNTLLDNITQGILLIDENRKILMINEALSNLFYIDPRKILQQKTVLVFNNKKLEDLITAVMLNNAPMSEDVVFYSDEDLYLSIEAVPVQVSPGTGGAASILIIMDNATREVEFSKLRSQFAANVSHEMRTPLTSIKGYIETILESGCDDSGMIKNYLGKSLKEVERLNFLIKDVLDLSKIEYRRNVLFQEDNDLVAIIEDIIRSLDFLARKNNISIDLSYSDRSILYQTDRELMSQLVRNILENAIFYSGKGSSIDVSIEDKKDYIVMTFTDNGMGIKKEDIPYIFQRFYRGKPDTSAKRIGSGLGLSIVKHTVDLHGGKIDVESMPGVRTRFTIRFPRDNKIQ